MANVETFKPGVKIPQAGTLSNLEYLALFDGSQTEASLADFLRATQATRSLGIFIKHLRTFRPIRTPYLDFDSREFENKKLISRFTSSIYRDPLNLLQGYVTLHGERRSSEGDEISVYSTLIPTHFNMRHDSTRPSEAFLREINDEIRIEARYNEAAAEEYDEHNSRVPIAVIKQAANDLLKLMGLTAGEVPYAPEIPESAGDPVRFVPEGINDDPDEFVTASGTMIK
jgi:hypothetical protein